jgi:hypothetical protein
MDSLARAESVAELHISDLGYSTRSAEMMEVVSRYSREFPAKRITLSDGHDTLARLRELDLLVITGSTLCNGTLDDLLQHARGGPRIVVQGQSASFHPAALFRRGVRLVTTTLKPPELVRLAASDPSGAAMQRLLEGRLPPIFCVPRNGADYA